MWGICWDIWETLCGGESYVAEAVWELKLSPFQPKVCAVGSKTLWMHLAHSIESNWPHWARNGLWMWGVTWPPPETNNSQMGNHETISGTYSHSTHTQRKDAFIPWGFNYGCQCWKFRSNSNPCVLRVFIGALWSHSRSQGDEVGLLSLPCSYFTKVFP